MPWGGFLGVASIPSQKKRWQGKLVWLFFLAFLFAYPLDISLHQCRNHMMSTAKQPTFVPVVLRIAYEVWVL